MLTDYLNSGCTYNILVFKTLINQRNFPLPYSYTYTLLMHALTLSSNERMKLSVGLRTLPKGRGKSILPHLNFKKYRIRYHSIELKLRVQESV